MKQKTIGPGSYEILVAEKDTIIIPFKMHHGKPLLELEINDKKATLMIPNFHYEETGDND